MDWFSWLSKTGLEPSLVYEYGLAFSHNELEEEDMNYINHEFLQSMGISIAKHRLEILKLARQEKKGSSNTPRPISRILVAIKRTNKRVANYIQTWIRNEDKALVVVQRPRPSYGSRWRGALLKKNSKRSMTADNQERLLLTNGNSPVLVAMATPRINSYSSPAVYDLRNEEKMSDDDDDGYWSTGVEEIRWDTMFQDLKPT